MTVEAQPLELSTFAFQKREARTRPKPSPPLRIVETKETFPHGWRYVTKTLKNGEQSYVQIPLKSEDFLNPQLGDVMPQNETHFQDNVELFNLFNLRSQSVGTRTTRRPPFF